MLAQRTLLDDIKAEISAAGGRYKLAHLIIKENPELFNYHDKRKIRNALLMNERMRRHRFKKPYVPRSNRNRWWSDEDLLYLRKNYGSMKTGQIAYFLGRTKAALVLKFAEVATPAERNWVARYGRYAPIKDNLTVKKRALAQSRVCMGNAIIFQ